MNLINLCDDILIHIVYYLGKSDRVNFVNVSCNIHHIYSKLINIRDIFFKINLTKSEQYKVPFVTECIEKYDINNVKIFSAKSNSGFDILKNRITNIKKLVLDQCILNDLEFYFLSKLQLTSLTLNKTLISQAKKFANCFSTKSLKEFITIESDCTSFILKNILVKASELKYLTIETRDYVNCNNLAKLSNLESLTFINGVYLINLNQITKIPNLKKLQNKMCKSCAHTGLLTVFFLEICEYSPAYFTPIDENIKNFFITKIHDPQISTSLYLTDTDIIIKYMSFEINIYELLENNHNIMEIYITGSDFLLSDDVILNKILKILNSRDYFKKLTIVCRNYEDDNIYRYCRCDNGKFELFIDALTNVKHKQYMILLNSY